MNHSRWYKSGQEKEAKTLRLVWHSSLRPHTHLHLILPTYPTDRERQTNSLIVAPSHNLLLRLWLPVIRQTDSMNFVLGGIVISEEPWVVLADVVHEGINEQPISSRAELTAERSNFIRDGFATRKRGVCRRCGDETNRSAPTRVRLGKACMLDLQAYVGLNTDHDHSCPRKYVIFCALWSWTHIQCGAFLCRTCSAAFYHGGLLEGETAR